jgi:hypothetical protein
MLSPEAKKLAEEHLEQIGQEIASFSIADHGEGGWGAEYLKHLRSHRDLWMEFLAN